MKNFQKIGFILALLFYFFAGLTPADALPETVLSVVPSAAKVGQGEAFTVAIDVADVVDLYGFALQVRFDPACLQVDNRLSAPLVLGGFLDPGGFPGTQSFNNEEGYVQFGHAQVNPSEAKTGSGRLLVIHFVARRVNCTTEIIIEETGAEPTMPTILTTRDSIALPYRSEKGSVEITGVSFKQRLYLPLIIYSERGN